MQSEESQQQKNKKKILYLLVSFIIIQKHKEVSALEIAWISKYYLTITILSLIFLGIKNRGDRYMSHGLYRYFF